MTKTFAPALYLAALLSLPAVADNSFEIGKRLFTQGAKPPCATCHTLSDAGASGQIGPNLDDLAPTADMVMSAVKGGVGVMPAYEETLSSDEIEALAHYVTTATDK